jgi:hypothetical protein
MTSHVCLVEQRQIYKRSSFKNAPAPFHGNRKSRLTPMLMPLHTRYGSFHQSLLRQKRQMRYAYGGIIILLRQITIRIHLRTINAFEILALDQRFYALLDHVDFWLELLRELTKSFRNELLM